MAAIPAFAIAEESPTTPDILALLDAHLAEMHRCSPACKVNALPARRLADPDVTFFAARSQGALAAIGALRWLDEARCEIKSMRAAQEWRGKGAGQAMLQHLLRTASDNGRLWVGLETGRHPVFAPATRLYAAAGFAECEPFDDYVSDDFSMCMAMRLDPANFLLS